MYYDEPSYVNESYRERPRYVARPSYRQQHSIETTRVLLLILTVALAVLAIGGALTAFDLAARTNDPATSTAFDNVIIDDASPAANASTPVSQWTRGEVPYLYQRDPAWAERPYAGDTIGTSGCGPTCLSMVYVALTGKSDYTPEKLCAFSERGGYVEDGMTRWALLDEGASQLGLSSRLIAATPAALERELMEGNPLMLSMVEGDFTSVGHFIVACGLTDQGELVIRDPNSPERSHQTWNVQRVLDQTRSIWSFSQA